MSLKARKVVIVYPWGIESVIKKNIGAGLRVGLLVDFLVDQGFAVTVVSIGRRPQSLVINCVRYVDVRFPSNILLFLLYGLVILAARILDHSGIRALTYYHFHRIDRRFAAEMSKLLRGHDIVLLEYPFFADVVLKYHGSVILTDHDVIAKSWCDPNKGFLNRLIYGSLLRKEVHSLQACFGSVVVSDSDRRFFESKGVRKLSVITNPIRLPADFPDTEPREVLVKYGLTKLTNIALFVGSGWYPNIEAARYIAERVAPECTGVTFVIIGACANYLSRCPENVVKLGVIPGCDLDCFYRLAMFALVNVTSGTGTSLKTLEALSYGKVVISTSIGVRGIEFKHDQHGIVCDDITRYGEILHELLMDEPRRHRISVNAVLLAARYDYRSVYCKYLEIINGIKKE